MGKRQRYQAHCPVKPAARHSLLQLAICSGVERFPCFHVLPPMPLPATGPSGAGKSTLLNALACRLDKGATLEGKVGRPSVA